MGSIIRTVKNLYSSSYFIQSSFKTITSSNLYYKYLNYRIKTQIEKDLDGPFNLLIETTNICNAACVMCPHGLMKRKQKIMSDKIFRLIIKRIKEEKLPIYKVYISGFGEPFTDPKLLSRIKLLKKLGLFVSFYTNASLLTQNIADSLVDMGLDEINVSFNGVTSSQYRQVMKLSYEKAEKNINMLLKARQKKQSRLPYVRISSVIVKQNESDIRKHIEKWGKKANAVSVSLAHEWGGSVKIDALHHLKRTKRTYPCRSLWHTLAIDCSGNFVICCRDYESKTILGSILRNSFSAVLKNKTLATFRNKHLRYEEDQLPPICRNCNFPYQDGFEWITPRSFS
jgi:radical SAM protein with 4Fe4S-binding SPASM domain